MGSAEDQLWGAIQEIRESVAAGKIEQAGHAARVEQKIENMTESMGELKGLVREVVGGIQDVSKSNERQDVRIEQLARDVNGVGGKIKGHIEDHKANRKWWAVYLLGVPAALAAVLAILERLRP